MGPGPEAQMQQRVGCQRGCFGVTGLIKVAPRTWFEFSTLAWF